MRREENANEYIYLRSKKVQQPDGGQKFRWYNFADVYGFRIPFEALFYLSPWEFLGQWIVIPLEPPWKEDYLYTRWISPMTSEKAIEMESQGDELLPGTHYEVNDSATTPHRLVSDCPDHALYCVYPTDPSVPDLSCFRSQWILRRRQRPVVPVLRGPMPHRGIKDKEKRSRLLSLYLRPWVMLRSHATDHVAHISNLNLCVLRSSQEEQYPSTIKRLRMTGRRSVTSDQRWCTRSYENAWRNYIQGNVVSEHSVRIIKNFLTLIAGTGKLEHDDDGVKNGKLNREQLGDPGSV